MKENFKIIVDIISPGDECIVVLNYPEHNVVMIAGTKFNAFSQSVKFPSISEAVVGKWQRKGSKENNYKP